MMKYMHGGKTLTKVYIGLRGSSNELTLTLDIFDNSLSKKWLQALTHVLDHDLVLEKNYCFLGFADSSRNGEFLIEQINHSIEAINTANLGYTIPQRFSLPECLGEDLRINQEKFNELHRYFEDLQGVSGAMSVFWQRADVDTQWHIRQLNLLCHEFECWAKSWRKKFQAPEWQRPSQLMCWLSAPRFDLEPQDLDLFGIETLNRPLGAVYVGVNKALGKHHWEVFNDENRNFDQLVTTTLNAQSEAAADFDIEWGVDPGSYTFQQQQLQRFREWLVANGCDPNDKSLTIGHPQIGQVDLITSFGTTEPQVIWQQLAQHNDVAWISCGASKADYNYQWQDNNFQALQIEALTRRTHR
jgi:hypothetical protein